MASGIVIPGEYSYVIATLAASQLVTLFNIVQTGKARKAANVPYPNGYATHAEASTDPKKFAHNCAQRAMQNTNDNFPIFLTSMLIGGLKYPILFSGLGAAWIIGRICYSYGYKNSKFGSTGQGRYVGSAIHMVAQYLMQIAAWYTAYQLLTD